MRKKPTIRMKSKETAAEVFELFLLTKRADGVKPRTIETYKQHSMLFQNTLTLTKR